MSLEIFKESVDKLLDSENFSNNIFMAGFGESMLNPQFWDMVKYAKRNDMSLMLPTNGSLLNKDVILKMRLIDYVQLSVDSLVRNKELKGGNINPLEWLPLFHKYNINVQINTTLSRDNYLEFEDFIIKAIRTNTKIYFMYTTPFDSSDTELQKDYEFCINNHNYFQYILSQYKVDGTIDTGCNTFKNCRYIKDIVIGWDGKIYPCNDALLMNYSFGHVSEFKNFNEAKKSSAFKEVSNNVSPMCNDCKFWDSVWAEKYIPMTFYDKRLDDFKNKHVNEDCFVLGHTMALTKTVLDEIKDKYSFSVNSIGYAKDMFNFEPTYCAIGDASQVLDLDKRKMLDKLDCQIFYQYSIFSQAANEYPDDMQFKQADIDYIKNKNMIAVKWINPSIRYFGLTIPSKRLISFDLIHGIIESGTSIQSIVLPLASWMGFKNIYLVAVDNECVGHFYDGGTSSWRPGGDIFRQFGWYYERLKENNQNLYNIGKHGIKGVPNITLDEALSDDK